jgi:uncharacterized membrane protein
MEWYEVIGLLWLGFEVLPEKIYHKKYKRLKKILMRCLFLFTYVLNLEKLYNSTQISLKVGIVLIILKAFVYELEYIV